MLVEMPSPTANLNYQRLLSNPSASEQFNGRDSLQNGLYNESDLNGLENNQYKNSAIVRRIDDNDPASGRREDIQLKNLAPSTTSPVYLRSRKSPLDPLRPNSTGLSHHSRTPFLKSWLWEICGGVFSLACLVAIIIILYKIQGTSLSSWKFRIRQNTLVSIFATLAKSALIIPVAACIGQLKWVHFKDKPDTLTKLDIFDEASRGPWGSLVFLWDLRGRALVASLGAVITLLALPIEPFTQQVISFPSRSTNLTQQTASIPASQIYDSGLVYSGPGAQINSPGLSRLDVTIEGAVLSGLYGLNLQSPFSCSAPQCTWPRFNSLGVCSTCRDVTQFTNVSCGQAVSFGTNQICNYTTPRNFNLSAVYIMDAHSTQRTLFNSTGIGYDGDDHFLPHFLVSFATLKLPDYTTLPIPRAEIFECDLKWCAKSYANAGTINGTFTGGIPEEIGFSTETHHWMRFPSNSSAPQIFDTFQVDNNTRDFSGNDTFTVNDDDWASIGQYFQNLFTTEDFLTVDTVNAVSGALYKSANLMETISNLTTSMTNAIRTAQNSTMISGTALGPETYVRVNWPWLILPIMTVLLANAFLAISIFVNARDHAPIWKSSSLALLFHGVSIEGESRGTVSTSREMNETAKQIRVRLEGDADHDFRFANI